MRARLTVVLIGSILVVTTGLWAGENSGESGELIPASSETIAVTANLNQDVTIDPWIHPKMSVDVREKLQTAIRIAADRIDGVDECRELFSQLGADGKGTLGKALYFPVPPHNLITGICRRSVAYTTVGGTVTSICPEFSRLSDERAAMFVVHEALHQAGLPEKPQDRRAMTSLAINSMVSRSCRL